MTTCVPIKDLKDGVTFSELVRSNDGPVIVTKNGKESFVSLSVERYEALCAEVSRARLYQELTLGEQDVREGRMRPASETLAKLRERYGC